MLLRYVQPVDAGSHVVVHGHHLHGWLRGHGAWIQLGVLSQHHVIWRSK